MGGDPGTRKGNERKCVKKYQGRNFRQNEDVTRLPLRNKNEIFYFLHCAAPYYFLGFVFVLKLKPQNLDYFHNCHAMVTI